MRFQETSPAHELTYSDVFLVPSSSGVGSRLDVSLAPKDGTAASIPIVSANMNSVTGPRLAATLARRGGLSVLPQDMHPLEVDAAIHWVKAQPIGFDAAIGLAPSDTVATALAQLPAVAGHGIVIHDQHGEFLGVILAEKLAHALPGARLGDLLGGRLTTIDIDELDGPRAAFDLMVEAGLDFAPVMHDGKVAGTLSRTGALRSTLYTPTLDAQGRLSVAAAVGINGDVAGKVKALAESGADVIVIDTAHGHQDGMIRAISAVAALDLGLP
ncbi:MAG: IMP dehydrogenase, partial [Salinibacterium sp.]|nr:IMP dehydrogenase [Salinibacterium sp.]